MQKYPKGFTLVELIVVITILAILGTIAFISLSGYALTSRDTVRVSDINSIVKVIELHRLEEGTYPVITNPINVTFSGGVIWKQGSFGSGSRIDAGRISEIPIDPLTGSEYAYSVTQTTAEYQVGTIIEGALTQQDNQSNLYTFTQQTNAADILSGFATTKIKGNYNGAFITQIVGNSVYVLGAPTILADVISDSTLESIIDTQSFVYEGGNKAPSTYTGTVDNTGSWGFSPAIQGSSSTGVIYEGTTTSLSTGAGKVAFVDNIQSYYENTDVENSEAFIELSNIDTSTTNGANAAQNLVNTYIETEVGGLGDEEILVSNNGNLTPISCILGSTSVDDSNNITAYQTSSVTFGNTCTSEVRTCNNGVLTGSYSHESCTIGSASSCSFDGGTVAHGSSTTAYQTSSVVFGNSCVSQTRTCNNGTLSGTYGNQSCTIAMIGTKLADIGSKTTIINNLITELGGASYTLCATTHSEATIRADCGYQDLLYLRRGPLNDFGIYYAFLPSDFHTDNSWVPGNGFLFSSAWPNNVLTQAGVTQSFSYRGTVTTNKGRAVYSAYIGSNRLHCNNGGWQQGHDILNRTCSVGTYNSEPSGMVTAIYTKD